MSFILSLIGGKSIKYSLIVSAILSAVYYLHLKPIGDLQSTIDSQDIIIKTQDNNISNLLTAIDIKKDEIKNILKKCKENKVISDLNKTIERIEREKVPKIDTTLGSHVFSL